MSKRLVWLDLETTDLKPGHILEVAVVVTETDEALTEVGRFHQITNPGWRALEEMAEWCWDTHADNGLLHDVVRAKPEPYLGLEIGLRNFLADMTLKNTKRLMAAGNNVGSFDFRFLRARVPHVLDLLHYRTLNVSTLYEYWKMADEDNVAYAEESAAHRAMDDVELSIANYRRFRERFR